MPIRAASDQGDIHAFTLNAKQWVELKATYRDLNLRMPCCGVPAIPKTSTRGTYFFAHARRGECTTADESPEHLYCKSLIAKAALDAGWIVTTERPGVSPAGEVWIADVFCQKGMAQLALEVQISPQTDEETIRRQLRYKASGVRGAWFFGARARRETVPFDLKTPAFSLHPFVAGELPTLQRFEVSLPEFVTALLQKRVSWTIPRYSRPLLVEFVKDSCWACKKPVKQVLEHMRGGESPDGEALTAEDYYEGRWNPMVYTAPSLSNKLEAIQADISNEELAAQGLNLIGRQDVIRGKPTRFPFCNLCLHCHAPQNNFYLSKHVYASMRQPEPDTDIWSLSSPGDTKTDDAEESSAFGIAVIPREVVGSGIWVLQEPPRVGLP
ncbi:MAG: hypothetical protein KGM60_06215 [Comamonadaceae bacterium]|nr:hypothetical protein [Comamonadaceae bacterium]